MNKKKTLQKQCCKARQKRTVPTGGASKAKMENWIEYSLHSPWDEERKSAAHAQFSGMGGRRLSSFKNICSKGGRYTANFCYRFSHRQTLRIPNLLQFCHVLLRNVKVKSWQFPNLLWTTLNVHVQLLWHVWALQWKLNNNNERAKIWLFLFTSGALGSLFIVPLE